MDNRNLKRLGVLTTPNKRKALLSWKEVLPFMVRDNKNENKALVYGGYSAMDNRNLKRFNS